MINKEKRKPKTEINYKIHLDSDQKDIKKEILNHPINIILGKPGTGKTLLAVQIALDLFFTRQANKIVITRPTVSTEDNGFLPGTIEEKMDPWLVPVRENMYKVYDETKIKSMEMKKDIEIISLSYFRGRTFENSICIVDEFQNLTEEQFEMALGRLGKDSKIIFCGDFKQCDLKKNKNPYKMMDAISKSTNVFVGTLKNNHRHEVLDEIFEIIEKFKDGN